MFAAAMIAATAAVADVTSANVVGYKTIDVSAGTMVGMGVQFQDVASETSIAVTNLISIPAADQKVFLSCVISSNKVG